MNSKFTWFLAVIALLLLAALFFGPGGFGGSAGPRVGGYVLPFEADEIRSIEIERDGEKVQLLRVPDGWQITEPGPDRADSAVVERILTAAQTLLVLDAISPAEFREKYRGQDFGFANPRQRLRLETRRGTQEVLFGREGAGDNRVFVRTNNREDTYLVPDELQKLLLEPVDTLRDPRLIPLPVDRIEKFRIERADGLIEVQRQGTRWRITSPLQDWADPATIDQTLEFILGARVFAFLPLDGAPSDVVWNSVIEIWAEGEDDPLRLRVADAPGEEEIFLEHPGRSSVVRVPGVNFHLLRVPLEALRSRLLLTFNPDMVDRFSIRQGETVAEVQREGDKGWREREADEDELLAPGTVESLFEILGATEVEAFLLGNPGVTETAPVAEVRLNSWLSENTPEAAAGLHPLWELAFWESVPTENAPGGVLVRINGEPGLRRLPASFLEDIRAWFDHLRNGKN